MAHAMIVCEAKCKRKRHVPCFLVHSRFRSRRQMNGNCWANERTRARKKKHKGNSVDAAAALHLPIYWVNIDKMATEKRCERNFVRISNIRSKSQFPIVKYAVFALLFTLSSKIVYKWLPYAGLSAPNILYSFRLQSADRRTCFLLSVPPTQSQYALTPWIVVSQVSNNCKWIFDPIFFLPSSLLPHQLQIQNFAPGLDQLRL